MEVGWEIFVLHYLNCICERSHHATQGLSFANRGLKRTATGRTNVYAIVRFNGEYMA